jgi:hypothetical protein
MKTLSPTLTLNSIFLPLSFELASADGYDGTFLRLLFRRVDLPATRGIIERKYRGGFDLMKPILLGEHKVGFRQNETT